MIINDLTIKLKVIAIKIWYTFSGCKDNYFFKESVIYFSYICFV